jgi:elongation of very long chain fatty acids protein 4
MAPKEEYALSSEFLVTQTPATLQGQSRLDEPRKQGALTSNANAPSFLARYACVAFLVSTMAVWWKLSFVEESSAPAIGSPMHSYKIPLTLTVLYVVSLPLLRIFATRFLSEKNGVDVKALLKETMIVYNASQVLLNGWMVYRFLHAILVDGQPFIGDHTSFTSTFAVWIHYTDKYLEFFDTFFMVLRGRMDQVNNIMLGIHAMCKAFLHHSL